jgi:very-short-patch-repair endonuclease
LPARQAKLIPGRKFAFDFAWPEHRLAVEVQGGIWLRKGAHTSGQGVTRDCEKAALALLEGFRTLAVTGEQVRSGDALRWIERLIGRP